MKKIFILSLITFFTVSNHKTWAKETRVLVLLDSINVDSFVTVLVPEYKFYGNPYRFRIVSTLDPHDRISWKIEDADSMVNFFHYTYDGVGNRIQEFMGSCYLKKDGHWYFYCSPEDKKDWIETISVLTKKRKGG